MKNVNNRSEYNHIEYMKQIQLDISQSMRKNRKRIKFKPIEIIFYNGKSERLT